MLGNDCVELFYDLSVSWQFNKNSAFPRPWRNDVKMVHERGTSWKCYRFSNHIGFFNFRILIAGILTHLKVISSNNPCFIIGSTCVFTLWRFLRGELGSTLPPCLKDFLCDRRSRKCWLAGVSCLGTPCWGDDGRLPWNKWLFSLPRHFSSGSAPSCTELRTGQSKMISGQCICVDLGVYVLRASKINKAAKLMFPWMN